MDPKYTIGQRVIIRPAGDRRLSPRDSAIDILIGKVGEVANYHWISPRTGKFFFIYTVRIGTGRNSVVLHEDEIEAYIGRTPR